MHSACTQLCHKHGAQIQAIHEVAICLSRNDASKTNTTMKFSDTCICQMRSYTYFDFELHHMASVPGVRADAGGLSGWTERTSRPDFVFERRCGSARLGYSIFDLLPCKSFGCHCSAWRWD